MKSIVIVFLFISLLSEGQNLVPNSHFDYYLTCPVNQGMLNYAVPWFNPTASTPDFWHSCANAIPNGLGYYQDDHSITNGGFVGIAAFSALSSVPNAREYLEVELTDSLLTGTNYKVSFFASLTETSGIAISDLGMNFSNASINSSTLDNIPIVPQIENPDTSYLSDFTNWMEVSGVYTAQGGEKFITIGNFRDSASSHAITVVTGGGMYSYYLIDDISVTADSTVNVKENDNPDFTFFPNPVNDQLYIKHGERDNEVKIINIYSSTEVLF
jgi:OOP family OmpA-OmpF porin